MTLTHHRIFYQNLGNFPLFPVNQLGSKVPEQINSRGGFIMVSQKKNKKIIGRHFRIDSISSSQPMFRREALWMSFATTDYPAVKVSVGG